MTETTTQWKPSDGLPRTAYTPHEVARSLGVHVRSVYRRCADGELESFRFGNRVLIPAQVLHDLVQRAKKPA